MVKSLCSFSYSKRFQSWRWNFACHVEQRSRCTKEVLLTCRWTVFVWLSNIKSLCKVIKCICCISSNAVFSSLASLGKPQGCFCLFRKIVRSGGAFLTYKILQYKLTAHLALQIDSEDYATLAFIPSLLLHDSSVIFQLVWKCQEVVIGRKRQVVWVEGRLSMDFSIGQSSHCAY